MKKLYMTDQARYSAIHRIRELVDRLALIPSKELDYTSYRDIVEYLSRYRECIEDEIVYKHTNT